MIRDLAGEFDRGQQPRPAPQRHAEPTPPPAPPPRTVRIDGESPLVGYAGAWRAPVHPPDGEDFVYLPGDEVVPDDEDDDDDLWEYRR
ncbi:hypothetical protein ACFYUL_17930 [Streptomyces sp. NPDC004311]|uniref:hypothetical protein n=1 Tax=Streptomyces sp. NPDC004311 TaxID=3364698 RepID=UPI0036A1E460